MDKTVKSVMLKGQKKIKQRFLKYQYYVDIFHFTDSFLPIQYFKQMHLKVFLYLRVTEKQRPSILAAALIPLGGGQPVISGPRRFSQPMQIAFKK